MVFRSRFETKATELFLLFFASPDIRFDAPRRRYVLACPDGSPQPLALVHASSTREIAFQRSIAQRAFSSSFAPTGGGRHLKGTVLLLSLLTNLFTGPARTGEEDYPPELRLEKALEADPRRVPILELAARLGMSPNTLRRRFRRFMNKNPQTFKTDHSLHLARYYILHPAHLQGNREAPGLLLRQLLYDLHPAAHRENAPRDAENADGRRR